MKSKTTIELNGQHYDSLTGKIVIKVQDTSEKQTTVKVRDVSRAINHAKAHAPQSPVTPATRIKVLSTQPSRVVVATSKSPNHTQAHTTQHAKTLRRDAVQKPQPSLTSQVKPKGALQHTTPSLLATKLSASNVDTSRLARAQSVERSPHIARHLAPNPHVAPTYTSLAVQPMPVKPEEQVPTTTPPPMPGNSPKPDIFQQALANAANYVDVQVHSQHFKQKTRNHLVSMAAGTFALIVIAGFAAYQNTPGLQLKVAGIQAGVSTHMPNLDAAGFAYKGVKADSGKLTLGFSDVQGDYHLTQQASNLSSERMIQTIGSTDASGKPTYTEVIVGGTTVYRFANNDATWIANGTWYTLSGSSTISNDKISSLVQNI